MQKTTLAALTVGAVILMSGCASSDVIESAPAKTGFGQFDSLEIRPFKLTAEGEGGSEAVVKMAGELHKKLTDRNADTGKKPLFTAVSLEPVATGKGLIAECTLSEYVTGNRALRYFVGFGAGKANTVSDCDFIARDSGEKIASGSFNGAISMGFFGGSIEEVESAMLDAIVKYIEENR